MKAKPYPLNLQHARHVKVLKHYYTKVRWYFETLCLLNSKSGTSYFGPQALLPESPLHTTIEEKNAAEKSK